MADYSQEQLEQAVLNESVRKDIESIKKSVEGIQSDLKIYAAQFVPNSMFTEFKKEIAGMKEDSEKVHREFETRIRFLERYAWAAIGILGVLQIVLQYIMPVLQK